MIEKTDIETGVTTPLIAESPRRTTPPSESCKTGLKVLGCVTVIGFIVLLEYAFDPSKKNTGHHHGTQ